MEKKTNTKKKTTVKKKTTIAKKKTNKKTKKTAFTLIELLAVIIILGVLMIIAIPAVTSYISNSRKSAYISDANAYIQSAQVLVNSGKLEIYNTDTVYYIPGECLKTESAVKSPYGEWKERYVGVTYNGEGFNYYWMSVDSSNMGINLTAQNDLTEDIIETNVDTVVPINIPGENKHTVKVLNKNNCTAWDDGESTSTGNATKIGNNIWKHDDLQITLIEDTSNCWPDGTKSACNASIIVKNVGTHTLLGWHASITFEDDIEFNFGDQFHDFATVTKNGNTYTFDAISHHYTNILPGKSIQRDGLVIKAPTVGGNLLSGADFDYEYLQDSGNENPADFTVNMGQAEYHFVRQGGCYDSSDPSGYYACQYSVTITNNGSTYLMPRLKLLTDSIVVGVHDKMGLLDPSNVSGGVIITFAYSLNDWDKIEPGKDKTVNLSFRTTSQNAKPNFTSAD